jgi:hypothetical protein
LNDANINGADYPQQPPRWLWPAGCEVAAASLDFLLPPPALPIQKEPQMRRVSVALHVSHFTSVVSDIERLIVNS